MAMIDFKTLQALVTGAIFQPRQAWERYRDSTPSTQTVLLGYALPVVVGTTVAAALLSFVFGTQDFWISGSGRSFVAMLREMVLGSLLGVVGLGILAGVVLVLARVFGGSGGYDRAFAMCSLVATPALVGAVPGALPWIGWLIQIAAVIYSLVLLYQAIPVFLNVEGGKRPLHFIATLVLVAVINVTLGAVLGIGGGSDERAAREIAARSSSGISEIVALREAADRDRYAPPANGEVSRAQARRLIKVAADTAQRRERYLAGLAKADEKMADSEQGLAAFARAVGSLSGAAGAGARALNAELEAVKQDGGNWAEHQWVRERLQSARFEIDDGPGHAHNRRLYLDEQAGLDRALEQLASY
jgi:hypothetical protein